MRACRARTHIGGAAPDGASNLAGILLAGGARVFMTKLEEVEATGEMLEPSLDRSPTSQRALSRWTLVAIAAGFLIIAFNQSWGLIEDDTRLTFLLSPYQFMESALHLWNENVAGGTAVPSAGYLFPIAPFFTLAKFLHVPVWTAERIWLALLLTVGCWGVIRLAEALRIGNRWAHVLAGFAYCVAPIVFTWISTSAALLAVVFLPWVVRPLVIGSREGSPRRAAARSGIAIALMGGVNAAVIGAVLPIPIIWLLTRSPGQRRRALTGWWVLATGLACFWWTVPAMFLGKYGFNYLPYTETSPLTTSTTSAFESLRGASYWLDYFNVHGPIIRSAWTLVSVPLVIVGTSVVTGLGLAGLTRRIPERLFLVGSLTVGVVAMAAGYAGSFGGILSHPVQHLLQTGLAPFRNVSKFSPDVALPLALGLAWSVSELSSHRSALALRKRTIPRATIATAASLVAVAAVLVAAMPFWEGQAYKAGGFSAIPAYWTQAGDWLDAHQGNHNALLLPGASFGNYTWGNPTDEPLQVVSNTALQWRNLIPTASAGYIQTLDEVDRVLDTGTEEPGLPVYLARNGVKYVVERNDLNLNTTGAPPPAQVHQVLAETPGLTEVASFGPYLPSTQVQTGRLPLYDTASDVHLRPVEIFRVGAPTSYVQTYSGTNPVVVSGDAGSLLALSKAGLVNGRASVLAGDPLGNVRTAPQATWAITDGNQRRDVSFGGLRNNASYLLGPSQSAESPPPGVPAAFIVVPGVQHQTVEMPIGASEVSASTFGSSALYADPSQGPASAFDGDPTTSWVANSAHNSVGQWVSITFKHPISLSTISIRPLVGGPQQPTVSRILVSTDRGSVTRALPPVKRRVKLTVAKGKTLHLQVRIEAVRPATAHGNGTIALGAGFSDILMPGVSFRQNMLVPDDETAEFSAPNRNSPMIAFSRPLTNPNFNLGFLTTDDPYMSRTFDVPKAMTPGVSGTALPVPGLKLTDLLDYFPNVAGGMRISASSSLGSLPRFRAENLIDKARTPWIANFGDFSPSLLLTFSKPQVVDSLDLQPTRVASTPTEISVTSPAGDRLSLRVPRGGGVITFPPLTTNRLTIHITRATTASTMSPSFGVTINVPVGLSSISVPGLASDVIHPQSLSRPVRLPCGQGPPLTIDGRTIETSVSGTLGDLVDLRPMAISICPGSTVKLTPGQHSVISDDASDPSALFALTSVVMADPRNPATASHDVGARSAHIESWNTEHRTIAVSSGPQTYLAVAQNYNSGWAAKLGGETLKSVRIDGWKQGYIVPAGRAGIVTMTMSPDQFFRLLLGLGAFLLLLLIPMALVPSRRSLVEVSLPRGLPRQRILVAAEFVILALVGGPLLVLGLPLLLIAVSLGPSLDGSPGLRLVPRRGDCSCISSSQLARCRRGRLRPHRTDCLGRRASGDAYRGRDEIAERAMRKRTIPRIGYSDTPSRNRRPLPSACHRVA